MRLRDENFLEEYDKMSCVLLEYQSAFPHLFPSLDLIWLSCCLEPINSVHFSILCLFSLLNYYCNFAVLLSMGVLSLYHEGVDNEYYLR